MLFICEAHTLFAITENFLSLMPSWLPFSISVISTNFSFIGLISCQSLWMKHSVLTSILGQMSKYSLLRIFFPPVNFIFQLPDQLLFKSLLPRLIWESAVIRTNRSGTEWQLSPASIYHRLKSDMSPDPAKNSQTFYSFLHFSKCMYFFLCSTLKNTSIEACRFNHWLRMARCTDWKLSFKVELLFFFFWQLPGVSSLRTLQ